MPRARVRSVSEQVTDTIRLMVLMGKLPAGTTVTQDFLAKELGVSTMPVREALLQLSHEGFIISGRGRSFRVAHTTRRDIADVFWVHATLAGELTARACARIDKQTIGALEAIHEKWLAAVQSHNSTELTETNFEFHRLINHAAASPKLLLLMRNTLRMIPSGFYSMLPEWSESSTNYHRGILDALRDGDAERARQQAYDHVLEAGKMLISFFNEKGYWTHPETGEQ